jgi:uncharacterized protein YdhG (YjbR/CyaY superfamily)
MLSGVSKEAAECRQRAAEFQEKANAASPEAREIYLLFQKSFLDLADAFDQDAKLREYGSDPGSEV